MNTKIFTDKRNGLHESSSNSSGSPRRKSEPYPNYNYHAESKYFLICKSCFWCASYLNRSNMISKCPVCANNVDALLDSIPISDKELYRIDCNRKRGITLEFASDDSKYYSRR